MTPEARKALLRFPAAVPPSGMTANFDHPDSLRYLGLCLVTSLMVLITLVVLMRVYTKAFIVRKLVIDDYALIAAWLLYAGAMGPIQYLMVKLPLGVHQWDLRVGDAFHHGFLFYVVGVLYGIVICVLKIAILLTFKSAFVPTGIRNTTFWVLHGLIWSNVVFYTIFTFLSLFSCTPRQRRWDKTMSGHCMDFYAIAIAGAIINTVSDALIAIVPQAVIWRLNMSWKKRAGISSLFIIGLLGCACAAMRTYYQFVLYRKRNTDQTYVVAVMCLWSLPEMASGFLVVSLPVMPKFIGALRKTLIISKIESALKLSNISFGTKGSRKPPSKSRSVAKQSIKEKRHVVSDVEFQELVLDTIHSNTSGKE